MSYNQMDETKSFVSRYLLPETWLSQEVWHVCYYSSNKYKCRLICFVQGLASIAIYIYQFIKCTTEFLASVMIIYLSQWMFANVYLSIILYLKFIACLRIHCFFSFLVESSSLWLCFSYDSFEENFTHKSSVIL